MKNRRLWISVVAGIMALIMILSLLLSILPAVSAKSSTQIKDELDDLKEERSEIRERQEELEAEIKANASQTQDYVTQKKAIDEQMKLIYSEIDNINAQIETYNLLIAEKQSELDTALDEQAALNEKYRARLRSMEEDGSISYWNVLFQANSFADLLDQMELISEIAAYDQRIIAEMDELAEEISAAQEELANEKLGLEGMREELAVSEAELEVKRAESDEVIAKLAAEAEELESLQEEFEDKEQELSSQIASAEKSYYEALKKEEEERKRQEQQQQQNNNNNNNNSNNNNNNNNSGNNGGGSSTSSGFLYPLPAGTSYVSCAYGWRIHPITGNRSFHTGVDLAAASGTSIYASKSGTVTTATYDSVWGYYVTINHGDGTSTLYGHMTRFTVSAGQSVSQGQVIGYVGSTGWSTGAHLHFNIYVNGSTVNPMSYVSVR